MESISVFDIFKVGVGPSSSHTMGPWRGAKLFLESCRELGIFDRIEGIRVDLFGSLAKTGKGHGTDIAILLGLSGEEPATCEVDQIDAKVAAIRDSKRITLVGEREIGFDPSRDLIFHFDRALPFHPNGMTFTAVLIDGSKHSETSYSVGGGFVVREDQSGSSARQVELPMPIESAGDLIRHCRDKGGSIPEIVLGNERAWRSDEETKAGLLKIWRVMLGCIHRGCRTEGTLPGGLNVVRRAPAMSRRLLGEETPESMEDWFAAIKARSWTFPETLRWVSCFALAVNEENAAFGRVVTAPTNGAAGVIPAVLMYYAGFCHGDDAGIVDFLLTAAEIGSLFKKGATISAAMGGCQAEIGVSSAMAAAGLCQVLGGTSDRALMAAEIAMEHHLGMTCDPVGGLVQVPCIERNTMGAIKAITACNMALEGDPAKAKVSLDAVIRSMWATALDMNTKYKETSEGGLAIYIPVSVAEC